MASATVPHRDNHDESPSGQEQKPRQLRGPGKYNHSYRPAWVKGAERDCRSVQEEGQAGEEVRAECRVAASVYAWSWPSPASRARTIAWKRSLTCSLAKMLET